MSSSFGLGEDTRALIVRTLIALIGAAAVGALVLVAAGLDLVTTWEAIYEGAVGNDLAIRNSLHEATPITITAIGVAIAFRAGLFNLGGQGQIYIGALAAVLVALYLHAPGIVVIVLALLAAMLVGGAWGGIAGALRARLGLSEIITTIMLNFIAFWLVSYLVRGPIQDPGGSGYPYTQEIPLDTQFGLIGDVVPVGAVLMVVVGLLAWLLIDGTRFGLKVKALGEGEAASRFAGIAVPRVTIVAMVLAGALGGLGGAASLLGVQYRLSDFFSPNWGFDAVATALIGRGSPIGTLAAGIFIGFLRSGIQSAEGTAEVPAALAQILLGVVVLFLIIANADLVVRLGRRLRQRFARRRGSQVERAA